MHGTAEDKAGIRLGSPRSSWCRSDQVLICGNATRKIFFLSFSTLLSLQSGRSPGYRCSGPGLMFCSIQAMTMAGLCHPGQLSTTMPTAPMCPGAGMGAPGPAGPRIRGNQQRPPRRPRPGVPRCCRRFSGARARLALSRLPRALRPGAPHRASLALRHLLSDQAALRLQGPQHAFAPELGGGDPVRSGRSWPVRRRPSWPARSCSGSGAASRIAVAGMPAPPDGTGDVG